MPDWKIEAMVEDDWPAVRQIYLEGIATGDATFETAAPDWPEWDAAHLKECRLVARGAKGVCAWAALSPVSRRLVYVGVAEVTVYVGAAHRGAGIGRALLGALVAEAERGGIWTLQASIFPENRASIRIHDSLGFREVGRRERIARHRGRWRDTVLMERRSKVAGI